MPITLYLIAGEASGDRLGAALMRGLKAEHGKVRFHGIGGPMMEAEGLNSLFPMHELSIFGLLEVLPKLRHLFRRRDETVADILAKHPDALITIDSPGFCFRVASKVRESTDMPNIHYVAPSVWAWKPGRAAKMAAYVDHVMALLPFEPPYMEAAGMTCDFVGHPVVAEQAVSAEDRENFREELGLGAQEIVTILPGSRVSEVTRLMPIFLDVAKNIRKTHPDIAFVIPVAAPHLLPILEASLAASGVKVHLLTPKNVHQKNILFSVSKAALAASGTVSIELAFAGTPMVIGYKTNWLTALIMRRAMLAKSFTLVNLLTDSQAVPEFEPRDCTVENLTREMSILLEDADARLAQIKVGKQAVLALGLGGEDPGVRAAKSVLRKLG